MCGIFFSSGPESDHPVSDNTLEYLCRRGPDQIDRVVVNDQNVCCSFFSSVLALRGDSLVAQPLQDPQTDSILCWNGEAWKIDDTLIAGNDAQTIFDNLLRAGPRNPYQALDERERLDDAIVRFLSRVSGPFAFIFYNARQGSVYYGRDRLGRRSLLRTKPNNGDIVISSVCIGPSTKNWAEVEADGVYVIHLANISENTGLVEKRIAWPETKDLHDSVSVALILVANPPSHVPS